MTKDSSHDAILLRDLLTINSRVQTEMGPLPLGGLPVQSKRKPQLPLPTILEGTPAFPLSDEDTMMHWKSVTATAALAAGSALTACGANGAQAPQSAPPLPATPETPTSVQMPVVEVVPTPEREFEDKTAAAVEEETPEPPRGPAIPAVQLRRQIMSLLGSFQSLQDLDRDNVERAFGVRIPKNPDAGDGYYFYKAETTEGWTYWIDISRLYGKDKPSSIHVYLDNGAELEAQSPAHCTFEFEPFSEELVVMGYERDERAYSKGGDTTWGFGKRVRERNAGFGIEILIFDVALENGMKTTCIEGLRIGGGSIDG